MKRIFIFTLVLLVAGWSVAATDEDGSRLWLRLDPASSAVAITGVKGTAMTELQTYWQGGPVVLKKQKSLARDGYTIKSQGGKTVIAASSDAGLLYGAYHLLRLQQTGKSCSNLDISEQPVYDLRILNHWDNPNGTVERGFAGRSIFLNPDLERMKIYGRANASIGINGTVLNNVNAKPEALSAESLQKAKSIADQLRPYGIRVYLSINFASPIKLGGLKTADPLNAEVVGWWKEKVGEIYRLIPDFGGFLVKANSEGEPGPQDFGRSHADGANMLAGVLKPHKGIVMWRAFVYNPQSKDRANQAYEEFMPLDGQFADNVIIQIKNGPIDFQPREPYSPLFTAMQKTPMMVEFQITQEYLGAANHLAYLAPMWTEFFSFVKPASLKAMAGVANIGDDTNWCGHHFAQSNWYAFGRLAWNPALSPKEIAEEWLSQTFGRSENGELRTERYDNLASPDSADKSNHTSQFSPLSSHFSLLTSQFSLLTSQFRQMLADSVAVKQRIVTEDPLEQGIRKALNLGHTIGHAFESFALSHNGDSRSGGISPILHGYAVAYGLVCELYLSAVKTGFPTDKMHQTVSFIKEHYGKMNITCDDYPTLLELMTHDKKNVAGTINFTLLGDIGDIRINQTATKDEIFEALDFYREC